MDKRICFLISKYIPKNWFSTKRNIGLFFFQSSSIFLSWYFCRYYSKFDQSKEDDKRGISLHVLPKSKPKSSQFQKQHVNFMQIFYLAHYSSHESHSSSDEQFPSSFK